MAPTKGPKTETGKRSGRTKKDKPEEAAKTNFEVQEVTEKLDEAAGGSCSGCGSVCAKCRPTG